MARLFTYLGCRAAYAVVQCSAALGRQLVPLAVADSAAIGVQSGARPLDEVALGVPALV